MEIISILFGVSLILFFGYFAEMIFKKTYLPDVLFLILLGVLLGPHVFNLINISTLKSFAPLFTSFTLLFLIFDGAFNINISSLAKGLNIAFKITLTNFLISSLISTVIFYYFFNDFMTSLFAGFVIGGVSSSFVMPVIRKTDVTQKTFSILAVESTLTDVLCIGSSITVLEIMKLSSFSIRLVLSNIISLFAIAGFIGIIGGIIWIIVLKHIFKEEKSYIMTISFLILIYVISEYVHGNGAIAALFFGLMLKNSRELIKLFTGMTKPTAKNPHILSVISSEEKFFYDQISFFLKTFFFVYIGLLLDLSDYRIVIVGIGLTLLLYVTRRVSFVFVKNLPKLDEKIVSSVFARGLAAAAIAQYALENKMLNADVITKIIYVVITLSIVFSSIAIFYIEREHNGKNNLDAKNNTSA